MKNLILNMGLSLLILTPLQTSATIRAQSCTLTCGEYEIEPGVEWEYAWEDENIGQCPNSGICVENCSQPKEACTKALLGKTKTGECYSPF